MAQILVFAQNNTHSDPDEDRRGCYKRGYCTVVAPDDHIWGNLERLPNFVVLKVPGVSVDKVRKYITPEEVQDGVMEDGVTPIMVIYRRRLWKLRWDDLPAAAKQRLADDGELVIKAGDYDGVYDYTWTQVKSFFRNQQTDLDETEDL